MSPGFPVSRGGVNDHTARIARHWEAFGCEVVVSPDAAGNAAATVASWRSRGIAAVLLQYVPFLYGRRGLSRFPRALVRAARAAGMRATLFVHEPWVPPTRLPWLVLSPLQRLQLLRLVADCDAVATAVPAWRDLLGRHTTLIAVGSTLGDPSGRLPTDPPLPAPAVFSPFAAGLDWRRILAAAAAVECQPRLTIIGAAWEDARERDGLRRIADPTWDWRGYAAPAAALALLARAPLVLAPFVDGLTGRRTSALAAASVGARVLTARGPLFDAALEGPAFTVADGTADYAARAASMWRHRGTPADRTARLAWYADRLAPAALDRSLLELVIGRPT